jgi:mRNA interferase RelE/StbE
VEKYKLTIRSTAEKELSTIPKKILRQVVTKIQNLADVPRPMGSEKLSGAEKYRIRQGGFRIVYSIDDKLRVIDVVKVGHRREVYR